MQKSNCEKSHSTELLLQNFFNFLTLPASWEKIPFSVIGVTGQNVVQFFQHSRRLPKCRTIRKRPKRPKCRTIANFQNVVQFFADLPKCRRNIVRHFGSSA